MVYERYKTFLYEMHNYFSIGTKKNNSTNSDNNFLQEEASGSSMASELNLSNVGGVFVVLMGGMGLALVVAIGEFLLECWDIAKDDQVSVPRRSCARTCNEYCKYVQGQRVGSVRHM